MGSGRVWSGVGRAGRAGRGGPARVGWDGWSEVGRVGLVGLVGRGGAGRAGWAGRVGSGRAGGWTRVSRIGRVGRVELVLSLCLSCRRCGPSNKPCSPKLRPHTKHASNNIRASWGSSFGYHTTCLHWGRPGGLERGGYMSNLGAAIGQAHPPYRRADSLN